jgi:hypothetical protein
MLASVLPSGALLREHPASVGNPRVGQRTRTRTT